MKWLVVILTVAYVTLPVAIGMTPLSTMARATRSIHTALQQHSITAGARVKRQINTDGDSDEIDDALTKMLLGGSGDGSNNLFCFLGCVDKFTDDSSEEKEASGGNPFEKGAGMGGPFKFLGKVKERMHPNATGMNEYNPKELEDICTEMRSTIECLDGCGESMFTNMVMGMLRPFKYMCVYKYKEFMKYGECYHKADSDDTKCEKKCGGDEKLEDFDFDISFDSKGDNSNITAMVDKLSDMCSYLDCHVQCMKPDVVAACDSQEAGELFENFMGHLIGGMTSVFDTMGMAAMNPPKCRAMAKQAGKLPGDDDIAESTVEKMTLKKLKLEMEVLEKESKKLDLEIEVLEMQKKKMSE